MDDFNSLYSDYQQAFAQGHNDGSQQAQQQTQHNLKQEAQIFTHQFAKDLALYETFLNNLKLTQQEDSLKLIKKIHSPILLQKCNELQQKMKQIVQKLESTCSLSQLDYSIQFLHFDRKELKSKFQTVISILGFKEYEKRAFKTSKKFDKEDENDNLSKKDKNEQDMEDYLEF